MIPGFCSAYIDKDNYRHLYFFSGINELGESIYNNIDLSNYDNQYIITQNSDGSIDYKFYDKHIIKITCKLVDKNNNVNTIILNFE